MTKRILFLAANPPATDRLRIDEEIREITESLERAQNRSGFEIVQKWAVRFKDFRKALLDAKPDIVHFSGHGVGENGIVLEDNDGSPKPVSGEVLGDLFGILEHVECVILNACYTDDQATKIAAQVSYVVGIQGSILDRAALTFSVSFYETVFAGYTYQKSFQIGCNTLRHEYPHESTPLFIAKVLNDLVKSDKAQLVGEDAGTEFDGLPSSNESHTGYIRRLQQSRTFQCGIIENIEEHRLALQSKGYMPTQTVIPYADVGHFVVVIELRGNQSHVMATLSEPGASIDMSVRSADSWIFIYVGKKSHHITILSPQGGYLLADNQRVDANIEFMFGISNLDQFWRSNTDPVANLEAQIVDKVVRYFSKMGTVALINVLLNTSAGREHKIVETQSILLNNNLLKEMNSSLACGVQLEKIHVSVVVNTQLHQLAKLVHLGKIISEQTAKQNPLTALIESHTEFMEILLKGDNTITE